MIQVEVLMNMEKRMRFVQARHYANLLKNQWWQKVATVQNISTGEEILAWILETARIRRLNHEGGNKKYSDMVTAKLAITSDFAGDSHEISRSQLEDLDANGVAESVAWAQQITTYAAYWPQEETARAMMQGQTNTDFLCFDGKQLFATDHPINYKDTDLGSYATVFTGSASGSYPGACPIHGAETYATGAVTVEVALQNLIKIYGYIGSLVSANGKSPLRLVPVATFCSPRLHKRLVQLSNAKLIAQGGGAGSYGGSGDVEAVIASLGMGQPIECHELAGYENDTTFFVQCENVAMPEIGPIVYANREPFATTYYTGKSGGDGALELMLQRTNKVEYHCEGRNGVFAGMPGLLFKCKAT